MKIEKQNNETKGFFKAVEEEKRAGLMTLFSTLSKGYFSVLL